MWALAPNMGLIKSHLVIQSEQTSSAFTQQADIMLRSRPLTPNPLSFRVPQVQSDTGGAVCPAVSPGRRAALPPDILDQEVAVLLRALHRGLHLPAQLHLAGAHPALLPHHLQRPDLRRPGQRHRQVHAV